MHASASSLPRRRNCAEQNTLLLLAPAPLTWVKVCHTVRNTCKQASVNTRAAVRNYETLLNDSHSLICTRLHFFSHPATALVNEDVCPSGSTRKACVAGGVAAAHARPHDRTVVCRSTRAAGGSAGIAIGWHFSWCCSSHTVISRSHSDTVGTGGVD